MDRVSVLLADDHAVVRAGLRQALEALPNLTVVGEVGDGIALMEALGEMRPDCLLIDVTMPHFEPIVMTKQIRETYPKLKILVVSAYDDDMYVQGLFRVGVNGYHVKDASLHDLRLAVQRVMAGERWVSARLLDKLFQGGSSARDVPTLTARQKDIVRHLLDGRDNLTIARELGISVKTVENHLTRLYRQLDVQSRLEAVNFVRRRPDVLGETVVVNQTNLARRHEGTKVNMKDKKVIMVVDDNVRYRGQLKRMIGKFGGAVIGEAGDTAGAVAWAEVNRPTLVFVDVVLGNEDGIQCVHRLKQLLPDVRMVMMTAYPDREFHRRGIEAGAIALLDKKDLDGMALQAIISDSV